MNERNYCFSFLILNNNTMVLSICKVNDTAKKKSTLISAAQLKMLNSTVLMFYRLVKYPDPVSEKKI